MATTSSASPDRANDRQALLVLGMHRSGTSAAAGVLVRLGATPPRTQFRATKHNQRGFTESPRIVDLHNRVLASLDSSWRDWEPLDPSWFGSSSATAFGSELRELIESEFGDARLIVVKDPRLCRLLPLWLEQLEGLRIQPRIVATVRNPVEVAASVESRDAIPRTISMLIWLRYMLDAEALTRHLPRAWIHYEDLLGDWRGVIAKLDSGLGINWPPRNQAMVEAVDAFLSSELRHHAVDLEQAGVHVWVQQAYAVLSDRGAIYGNDAAALRGLDPIRKNFDAACEMFRPIVTTELRNALGALERANKELYRQSQQTEQLVTKLANLTEPTGPRGAWQRPQLFQILRMPLRALRRRFGAASKRSELAAGAEIVRNPKWLEKWTGPAQEPVPGKQTEQPPV